MLLNTDGRPWGAIQGCVKERASEGACKGGGVQNVGNGLFALFLHPVEHLSHSILAFLALHWNLF